MVMRLFNVVHCPRTATHVIVFRSDYDTPTRADEACEQLAWQQELGNKDKGCSI